MNEKRDCKIVQDLLPNYIENLTNEETNKFIEEHLNSCKQCKQILENMRKDLNVNVREKDKKTVKYFKKYRNKLKILYIFIVLILLVALILMVRYYLYFRDGYFNAANRMLEIVSEEMYPDAFYATIEEITDTGVDNLKTIRVKGLDINDKEHRREFYFDVSLENIGSDFRIKFNGSNINFEDLKVGQKIAVYNYGEISETEPEGPGFLTDVKMVVVLDDEL